MNMIPDPALQHEQIDEVTETGLNIAEMKVGGMTPSSTPEIYFAKKSMIKTSKLKVFDFDLNSLLGEFSRFGDLINMLMFSRQSLIIQNICLFIQHITLRNVYMLVTIAIFIFVSILISCP